MMHDKLSLGEMFIYLHLLHEIGGIGACLLYNI